jgi:hypothetical protein
LRIKEQETRLTLQEHDDDDDDEHFIMARQTFLPAMNQTNQPTKELLEGGLFSHSCVLQHRWAQ